MEKSSSNVTLNSSKCLSVPKHVLGLSLIDVITLLMGHPVVAQLLWITFTSKKTIDILNCNLALFHNLQYLLSVFHFAILLLLPCHHQKILAFLFVYMQVGGPMSLSFISLERYVAVSHPTSYPLLKKYRCREVCAGTVWLISLPSALATVLAPTTFTPSSLAGVALDSIPLSVMVAMAAMMVWCSSRIAKTLKKAGPGRDEVHPVKRRALTTVRITSLVTLFCYIPVTILQRYNFHNEITYVYVITPVCIFLMSVASIVHPLFYISAHRKLFTCSKWEKKVRGFFF